MNALPNAQNFPGSKKSATVSDFDINVLTAGQKQELEIKLEQGHMLAADIQSELDKLAKGKQQAAAAKNTIMVDQIIGLQDSLIQLEKSINIKIKALKKQLAVVPKDLDFWLNKIDTDCTEYLAQVKQAKRWLYSCASGAPAYVAKSWLTRRPKDTDKQAQIIFDQMLAQLGFVALRGNSIFTTSNFGHAAQWGDRVYVIFPVDKLSHYTYTNQSDLVLDNVDDVGVDKLAERQLKKDLLAHVTITKQALGKSVPSSLKDLEAILRYDFISWDEVFKLLNAFKKTGMPYDIPDKFFDPNLPNTLVTTNTFVKRWQPHQDNLSTALTKGREVYVSGTYYALDSSLYGAYIRDKFNVNVKQT